jgi:hypothetical protein
VLPNFRSDDVRAGLLFLALGLLFGADTLLTLDIGDPAEMGPGFFPLALCAILSMLGVGILLRADKAESGQEKASVNWRAVVFVAAAPVVFGLTIRSLGLLPALIFSVALAVIAGRRIGWWRGVLIVVGVTVFCIAVFKWGLQSPFDLINRSLLD